MSQLTRSQYETLYGSSGTVFPDNTTGDISEGDMRQFGQDQKDSLVFKIGVVDGSTAGAGELGELSASAVSVGSAVSLSTTVANNVTSLVLTAGDWDVEGAVNFTEGSSTVTERAAAINNVSATVPTDGSEEYNGYQTTTLTTKNSITLTKKRFSSSGSVTVYLIGRSNFSAGTVGIFGYIVARRVR